MDEAAASQSGNHQCSEKKECVYTVDEAMEKIGYGYFQVLIAMFCGLLWLVDALEFMLLSVLSAVVKCQWDLSETEEALITSLVFVGFLLGGVFWGIIMNVLGRKTGLFIINLVTLTFGILSALKLSADDARIPGFPWLLVCRFGVGFGAGGVGQSVTFYTEFLPLKWRGACIVLLGVWWALGTMGGAGLAVGVLGASDLGWHWYLGLAAIPMALTLFLFPFIPESARYYLVKGKDKKAQKVIERVAWYNCRRPPPGRVVLHEEKVKLEGYDQLETQSDNGQVQGSDIELTSNGGDNEEKKGLLVPKQSKLNELLEDTFSLFQNGTWKTTLILLFLWFGSAWLYYGVILLTTTLLRSDPHCGTSNINYTNNSRLACEELHTGDYLKILWTAAAELPGLLITVIIIEIIGRKITMAIEFMVSMLAFLLLFICASDSLLTFFLFIARGSITGVFQAVYIYTAEIYPTSARPIGFGICTSVARVGAIVTPYVAQVLFYANDYATLSFYAGSSLVLAVLVMLLPIETKGRALHDKGSVGHEAASNYCQWCIAQYRKHQNT